MGPVHRDPAGPYSVEMAPQATFDVLEVLQCSAALRAIGEGATSLEEVAADAVVQIREHFVDKLTGLSALPLVRCYVTRRWGDLEPALQDFSRAAGADAPAGPDVV